MNWFAEFDVQHMTYDLGVLSKNTSKIKTVLKTTLKRVVIHLKLFSWACESLPTRRAGFRWTWQHEVNRLPWFSETLYLHVYTKLNEWIFSLIFMKNSRYALLFSTKTQVFCQILLQFSHASRRSVPWCFVVVNRYLNSCLLSALWLNSL